jgi:hypothetical protein
MECFKGWGLLGLEQWICNSTDPTIPLTTFNKTMTVIISVVTISAGLMWRIICPYLLYSPARYLKNG